MKTTTSRRIVFSACLTALLAGPVFAAFGDNTGAAGSALPPGTYPSSPSDSSQKTDNSTQKQQPAKKAPRPKPAKPSKERKDTPRSGS